MIQEIYIRDLGIIREARLQLKPGLNVITGETGAGKTMVLSALGLLLGQRADASLVRTGQGSLLVEGRIALNNAGVLARVEELGGQVDDGDLIMNRQVSNEGKSRAMLGGASVPISALGEIGEQLVVVHGQSDQLRLKSAAAQRDALDEFADHEELLNAFKSAFDEHQEAKRNLELVRETSNASLAEVTLLETSIQEIEKTSPKPDEDVILADLANRLGNLEALRMAASSAHEAMSSELDGIDVLGLLASAKKLLEHENDSKLQEIALRLSEVNISVRDIAAELSSYVAGLDTDSELSLDQIQNRRAELSALMRKYAPSANELIGYLGNAKAKLAAMDNSDERLAQLQAEVDRTFNRMEGLAGKVSDSRKQAAKILAQEVSEELSGLAMQDSKLMVEVSAADTISSSGQDQVAFMLTSYSGANPRPIAKAASGGEMSRIMLALEVALAKNAQNSTFIFDEVDAGVGGAAAIEVGRRLALLARQTQVIVVTHLAQVAAFADHQLQVQKNSTDNISETDVVELEAESRLEELARMLSGLSDSTSAREHAAELMSLAKSARLN